MKWRLIVVASVVITLVLTPLGSLFGQDLVKLLEAIDKVEANLKMMIEKQAKEHTTIVSQIQTEIDQLKTTGAPAGAVDKAQFMELWGEVESLKEPIAYLTNQMENGSGQLASIDEEGGVIAYPTSDNRMDEVVERLVVLNEQLEELVATDKSETKGIPHKTGKQLDTPTATGHGRITLNGFLHQQYHNQNGDEEKSTFVSKRARLGVKGKLNEYATIKLVGEFAKSPKLLDGVLTLSPDKHWTFYVGQFKTPFGTDFLTSSTAMPFVNGSLAKKLGPDRDIGVCLTFKDSYSENLSIKATAGLFNGSGINTSDANNNKNIVGRVELNFAGMFTVAPNFFAGKNNEIAELKEDIASYGSSLTWNWNNAIACGELIHSEFGDTEMAGWYLWGGYSFKTNSRFLPEIQTLVRYEQYDGGLGVSNNCVDRLTFGTNLYIDKKYTKIQINYQVNGEEAMAVDNNEFMVNFQVAF